MSRCDQGTGVQAIEFVLMSQSPAWSQEREFLEAWFHGDLTEWPEYYVWLDRQNERRAPLANPTPPTA